VLAEAPLPVVHRGSDLGHVSAELRIGEHGQAFCPGVPDPRRQVPGHSPDAAIENGDVRARSGERPPAERRPDDLAAVQPGHLGAAHGPPQPVSVFEDLPGSDRIGMIADRLGVSGVRRCAALVHPDRVQHAKVVGVR